MAQIDFGETICEAVNIIVEEKIKGIQFDKTINCTIIDAEQAKDGLYRVTDGSTKFYAYSASTDYKKNDAVYVTVPNGDFNNQKIIIGKQITKNTSPFLFTTPFDTMVDVSTNLIDIKIEENNCWLRANDPSRPEILLWSKNFKENEQSLAGFTRLGILGSFRSWLNGLNCNSGEYGYKLVLGCEEEILYSLQNAYQISIDKIKSAENIEDVLDFVHYTTEIPWTDELWNNFMLSEDKIKFLEDKKAKTNYSEYTIYLNTDDMYGNPYEFESFYKQEKVFDISNIKQIIKMDLYFYQKPESFIDLNKQQVPYEDQIFKNPLSPNLFTTEPYICLGYDVEEFFEDQATLYCLDSLTYTDSALVEKNTKHIILRWVREFEDGRVKSVSKDNDLDYEIRWYQYVLGSPSADEYSGVYWRRIENTNEFSFDLNPSLSSESEQIKVVILYNNKIIRSNVITFTNQSKVSNDATMEALAGLNIWCNDKSYGNYFIYDPGNKILEQYNIKQARRMSALFSIQSGLSKSEKDGSVLTEANSITWSFPIDRSMIIAEGINYSVPFPNKDNFEFNICAPKGMTADKAEIESYLNEDNEIIYKTFTFKLEDGTEIVHNEEDRVIQITRYGDLNNAWAINSSQLYFLKETYSQENTNNIIQCSIVKDHKNFFTAKEFFFGQSGTTGTDTTLRIYIDPSNEFALDIQNPILNLKALLFNSQNQEVDLKNNANKNVKFEWSWFKYSLGDASQPNIIIEPFTYADTATEETSNFIIKNKIYSDGELIDEISYYSTSNRNSISIVDRTNTINMNQFLILQCTVTGWGDYPLVTYKPIALCNGNKYSYVDCANEVIYLTSGYPEYYKDTWKIHLSNTDENQDGYEDTVDCNWEIFNPFEEDTNYIGTFKNNLFKPLGIYMSNVEQYGAQCKINEEIVWTQPIICLQNNYPSTTLNQWSGKEIEIDYDKGKILAPAIAAGKKVGNTFSGVMIGDWNQVGATANDITKQTGIYGFHEGAMSYAFKEDGTAFIGKAGKGRLLFDGNESTIASENYKQKKGGLLIDLDDGYIDIRDSNDKTKFFASGGFITEGGQKVAKPYLEIKGSNNKTLMYIGENSYYLQSNNYSGSQGLNININDGRITAYDFYLNASSYKGTILINSGASGANTIERYPRWDSTLKQIVWEEVSVSNFPFMISEGTGYNTSGNYFGVDWTGSIYASHGYIGNFVLTKTSLYSSDNGNKFGGTGIYLGDTSTSKTDASGTTTTTVGSSFSLGDKFRFDGSKLNGKGKLYIASNIYRPNTSENADGVEVTTDYFLIGVNESNPPRLQIGAAVAANTGYDGISMYGNSGDIFLVPEGKTVDNFGLKVGITEVALRLNNLRYLRIENESDGVHLRVTNIDETKQHGIYARFA